MDNQKNNQIKGYFPPTPDDAVVGQAAEFVIARTGSTLVAAKADPSATTWVNHWRKWVHYTSGTTGRLP